MAYHANQIHYHQFRAGAFGTKYYQLYKDFKIQTRLRPMVDIETRYISLTKSGLLTLRAGFVWDGASGPTFNTKSSMRGSAVHDALYRLMRFGALDPSWRKPSDEEIRDICIYDKMWKFRARSWYRTLRLKGGSSAAYKPQVVLSAP